MTRVVGIHVCLLFADIEHIQLMAEKLFYCNTCNVHLTGPQPALQHYNGSKHRKNEAVKQVRNSAAFTSAITAPTTASTADYSTAESALGQICLLKLSSLASGYSDDWTKSGDALKSAETAPKCSVVMVPSLNPDLPAVPVTMTEKGLPETEYEFQGGSGLCHLCDVELTSQQHASQHLAGQKHLKAKKQWEARREQLQMTVSGLCPSMKSKPIAMCQPLVSELPAKDCYIRDIIAKYNSSRSVLQPTAAAGGSTSVVDGLQWFSCEVCDKKMNTAEMLELHRQSPAHLKKVERHRSVAQSGDNTVWQTCPTCQKKLNSPLQLEIHMTNHSRPASRSSCPPSCPPPVVATPGVQWYHCDVCNKFMNTAAQLELHRQTPAHQKKNAAGRDSPLSCTIGDNTVWQTCPVCAKRVNSLKQLDIHMNSHGLPAGSLLYNMPRGDLDTLLSDTENQLTSRADSEKMLKNLGVSLSAAEKIDPPIEFGDKVNVNLQTLVDQLQLQEESSKGDVETSERSVGPRSPDVSQPRSSAQQLSDSSANQTFGQTTFTVDAAAAANLLELVKTVGLSPSQDETRWTSSENSDCPTTRQAEDNSAIDAAAAAEDSEKFLTDDDLITSGCCPSPGCAYHCELCEVHLSGDEPRNMHVTGSKHITCRQKAEESTPAEHNPFSPSFRFFCQLCSIPLNTLRDKRQHERGQQHISKSLRCVPAPQSALPDIVLPADGDVDSCMPGSLVTSTPRSYQEELYFKALVADSICYLPTGTDSSQM